MLVCCGRGATIVIPDRPAAEERKAADDLAHVWLRGTGEVAEVLGESDGGGDGGPRFFVGETKAGKEKGGLPEGTDGDGFRVVVIEGGQRGAAGCPGPTGLFKTGVFEGDGPEGGNGRAGRPAPPLIILRGASGLGTEFAVDWFAQHELGVRWFRSGEIGEVVPDFRRWVPRAMDQVVVPAFVSRQVGSLGPEDREWGLHNGLNNRLPHGHALLHVFPSKLFDKAPEWFPMLRQKRGQEMVLTTYRPRSDEDYNWQPNLALPEVAEHAAEVADRYFDGHPGEQAFSLSENDSIRFDESDATARARGPLRWFRGKPDYSDLVFGFMNRVADEVAVRHPDKLLSAYAYYWCENSPSFAVRPNVLPWLTADRSEYFDPKFEKEDHALIRRWCRSGARVVGIYDYLEGDPYLVPRQTARMTAGSIQFAYRAGVRAYTAEGTPNWGLDGPKLWVAAQLLWDPNRPVGELLDEYYSGYWGEAAPAMRRFDELCEKTWRSQPKPAAWIKYYLDESQAGLFPEEVCVRLRRELDEAGRLAREPEVRERVEVVSAAFAVTERFAAFCRARDELSGAGVEPPSAVGDARLVELLGKYKAEKRGFLEAYGRAVEMGGVARMNLNAYLRNDPTGLVAFRGKGGERAGFDDQEWRTLAQPGGLDDRTFDWSFEPWTGHGQPAEGRSIKVASDAGGR